MARISVLARLQGEGAERSAEVPVETDADNHLVVIGYGVNGRNVSRAARMAGIPHVVVEMNPHLVAAGRLQGVPILSAFTGSHSEYHTPRDTPDTLNYEGAAKIARFMGLVARSVAASEALPDYIAQTGPEAGQILDHLHRSSRRRQ